MLQQVKTGRLGTTVAVEEIKEEESRKRRRKIKKSAASDETNGLVETVGEEEKK